MAAILAALKYLPELILLLKHLRNQFGDSWEQRLLELNGAYDDLRKAKTDAEIDKALKSIADTWGR